MARTNGGLKLSRTLTWEDWPHETRPGTEIETKAETETVAETETPSRLVVSCTWTTEEGGKGGETRQEEYRPKRTVAERLFAGERRANEKEAINHPLSIEVPTAGGPSRV